MSSTEGTNGSRVEINDSDNNNCVVCQVPAKSCCSACKTVKYCGPEHQRQHWKQHKIDCRPYRIDKDPDLGRYLLATRDIKAGSVVFVETPLIVGPKWYLNERDEQVPVMPCVGCFTPCRMGKECCVRCRWPACSSSCAGLDNRNLHGFECNILSLGPGPATNDARGLIDYYRSDALVVLKCLILQHLKPKKWSELMDMQSHEKEREGSELKRDADRRIVAYLEKNFLQPLRSLQKNAKDPFIPECDESVLHRICGIIETNYMCINLPSGIELSGVFYTACMMEHACQPNCHFQFDYRNGFKISVIAGRDITKGEHLIIMYSNMLWGTQMRHEHLQMTKHFTCRCERCADPTEYGTYLSALRCMGAEEGTDCGGWQLPKDPLAPKSDWSCDRCPVKLSSDEVRYLLSQIGDEVETLLARKPTIHQLETVIEKLSKFLHPHHYHLFNLKHSLIQLYGTESGYGIAQLSDALLNKKMQLCDELFDICQRLDPYTIRLSIYVGIVLYEMHKVLVERGKRLLAKSDRTDVDVQTAVEGFKEARDHLLKAAKMLEKELDNVAGCKLSDAVLKALNNLEAIIANN